MERNPRPLRSYAWHDIDTRRAVGFAGFADTLSADYDAHTVQAFGELATRLDAGGWRLEPFAGAAYIALDAGGFAESGGAAALSSAGSGTDTTFTTLGIRAGHDVALGSAKARLTGMLGWQHAFGSVPTASLAFADTGSFAVAGTPLWRSSVLVEAGLELDLGGQTVFGIFYRGAHAQQAHMHNFEARAGIRF